MPEPSVAGTVAPTIDTAAATTTTANLPTGIQADEVLILHGYGSGVDGTPNTTLSGDTGWVKIADLVVLNSQGHYFIFKKQATGSEPSTVTITTDVAEDRAIRCFRVQDWDTTVPIEITTFIDPVTTGASVDPPSITPSWDPSSGVPTLIIALAAADSSRTLTAGPSGYNNFAQTATGTTNGGAVGEATLGISTVSEDPGAFTMSAANTRRAAATIAIAGAAATPPETVAVDGSITPTGDITELGVGLTDLNGSITPTGALSTNVPTESAIAPTGSIEPVGLLYNNAFISPSGSITPTGNVLIGAVAIDLVGSLTPTGEAFVSTAYISPAGSITPQGGVTLNTGTGGGGNYEKWKHFWHDRRRRR